MGRTKLNEWKFLFIHGDKQVSISIDDLLCLFVSCFLSTVLIHFTFLWYYFFYIYRATLVHKFFWLSFAQVAQGREHGKDCKRSKKCTEISQILLVLKWIKYMNGEGRAGAKWENAFFIFLFHPSSSISTSSLRFFGLFVLCFAYLFSYHPKYRWWQRFIFPHVLFLFCLATFIIWGNSSMSHHLISMMII